MSDKFCEGKSKAIVWFKFLDKPWDKFETADVPVHYTLTTTEGGGACSALHDVRVYYSGQNADGTFFSADGNATNRGKVLYTRLEGEPDARGNRKIYTAWQGCDGVIARNGGTLAQSIEKVVVTVIEGPSEDTCLLEVFSPTRKVFERLGNKCPEVKIACENDCPSGFLKCKSTVYPGYRCVPCSEFRR